MDPALIAVFIPIVAIVMGIGIGMLSIWSEHKRKAQMLEQNHRERMHAIEKGIELPPLPANLIGSEQRSFDRVGRQVAAQRHHAALIGVVLYFAITVVGADQAALFGLIPAAIGIANLVYAAHSVEQGKSRRDPRRSELASTARPVGRSSVQP